MKVLTKEEEQEHYKHVIRGGLTGGVIGLGVGLAGSMLLQRRWAFYRTLTTPLKAFFVTSTGTFTAIIEADRSSRSYEMSRHADKNMYQDTTARKMAEIEANRTSWEKAMALGKQYRYSIVMGAWAASMAGSLAVVSRDKYLTTAQKLVQARMYAQGLTLLILVATAAFEVSDARARKNEVVQIEDPKHPGRMIEKKVHHEHYQGEDLWKDMVAAEERRIAARKNASGH